MLPMSTIPQTSWKRLRIPRTGRRRGPPRDIEVGGPHGPLEPKACRQREDRQGYERSGDTQWTKNLVAFLCRTNGVGIEAFIPAGERAYYS